MAGRYFVGATFLSRPLDVKSYPEIRDRNVAPTNELLVL